MKIGINSEFFIERKSLVIHNFMSISCKHMRSLLSMYLVRLTQTSILWILSLLFKKSLFHNLFLFIHSIYFYSKILHKKSLIWILKIFIDTLFQKYFKFVLIQIFIMHYLENLRFNFNPNKIYINNRLSFI